MNLWLRMLRVLIASLLRSRLAITGESVLRFRVMPHDLDINIHMNNARYLALMDLGRLDMIVRGGLWRGVLHRRWQPVIGGSLVRYRRPLKPFQAFELKSRLLAWDNKWLYIEHRIEAKGVLACHTVVRAGFVGGRGMVPSGEVMSSAGHAGPAPELPAWAGAWRDLDGLFDQQPPLMLAGKEVTCTR